MHIRTVIYCIENNIDTVFDGANKYAVTTDQSEDVISAIKNLYNEFNEELRRLGVLVEEGLFGADMLVNITNDGPVTILLESRVK